MNNAAKFLSSVYTTPHDDMKRMYQYRSDLKETFSPVSPTSTQFKVGDIMKRANASIGNGGTNNGINNGTNN